MKELIVYNDVHLYGPHEMKVEWGFEENAFYLGDNVDLRNCKHEDLKEAMTKLSEMHDKFGDRYIGGNHELDVVSTPLFRKVGNTLLSHGDVLFWGEQRAVHYRRDEQPGASWWKRLLSMGNFDWLRYIRTPVFTQSFLDRCFIYANLYKCKMVVCGHRHPSHAVVREYKGVHIIVLPRGKNVIDIE